MKYVCGNGHQWLTGELNCLECGRPWIRCSTDTEEEKTVFGKPHCQTFIFKPYVEENAGKEPVFMKNRQFRDKLSKDRGLTYDSTKYFQKPETPPAASDLNYGDVKPFVE